MLVTHLEHPPIKSPRDVATRTLFGVHALSGRFHSVRTLLVWRRDSPQAKIAALAETLVNRAKRHRARNQ